MKRLILVPLVPIAVFLFGIGWLLTFFGAKKH